MHFLWCIALALCRCTVRHSKDRTQQTYLHYASHVIPLQHEQWYVFHDISVCSKSKESFFVKWTKNDLWILKKHRWPWKLGFQVIDSSWERNEPITLEVGFGDIVNNPLLQVFDSTVRDMAEGDQADLKVIGPPYDTDLVFKVPTDHPEVLRLQGRYKSCVSSQISSKSHMWCVLHATVLCYHSNQTLYLSALITVDNNWK